MDLLLISVIAVIAVALIFDFTNGFHDAGNAVATVVATRAMPAKWAPAFSAFFNFVALFWMLIFGSAVADTIAKTVKTENTGVALAFAALFAAIVWNFITWRLGLPSSSSHAIIGGLVGAGIAAGGFAAISGAAISKAACGIHLSPLEAFGMPRVSRMSSPSTSGSRYWPTRPSLWAPCGVAGRSSRRWA